MNRYQIRPAEQINEALNSLPKAVEHLLFAAGGPILTEVDGWKGIEVTHNDKSKWVQVPTSKYHLVQHEQAFRPIVEGLTQAGVKDFQFVMAADHKKAEMQIYTGQIGFDTVQLGFRCVNSFDRTTTIQYGLSMNHIDSYIEIVGYRQVCSNGMVVRVPLTEASIIKPELVVKLKEKLWEQKAKIRHNSLADKRLLAIQYAVEAVALLAEPVEMMIKTAIGKHLSTEQIIQLVETHITKRYRERVLGCIEGDSLWDLYNAITYVASHDDSLLDKRRVKILEAGANLLMQEVRT